MGNCSKGGHYSWGTLIKEIRYLNVIHPIKQGKGGLSSTKPHPQFLCLNATISGESNMMSARISPKYCSSGCHARLTTANHFMSQFVNFDGKVSLKMVERNFYEQHKIILKE